MRIFNIFQFIFNFKLFYFYIYYLLYNYSKNNINLNIKMIGYKEKIIQLDLSKTEITLGKLFLKPQFLEFAAIHISTVNRQNWIA